MSRPRDPVSAKVAEAARRLVGEIERPGTPDAAVSAARDLSAVAEVALQVAVERARQVGQSWRDIGRMLGTSRQAAFQRFGQQPEPSNGAPVSHVSSTAVHHVSEFVARFTAERWDEVFESFNEPMRRRHDRERLGSGWAGLLGLFGRFQGLGPMVPVRVGGDTVVDVLLRFEAGEAMLWARFDATGKVAGLRLHPAPAEPKNPGAMP